MPTDKDGTKPPIKHFISLQDVAGNPEIRELLEANIISDAREKLFKEFKCVFRVQRTLEVAVIAVAVFLGYGKLDEIEDASDNFVESSQSIIVNGINTEFRASNDRIVETNYQLKTLTGVAQEQAKQLLKSQEKIQRMNEEVNSLFDSDEWEKAVFAAEVAKLAKEARENPDSLGVYVQQQSELKEKYRTLSDEFDSLQNNLPRSYFSSLSEKVSTGEDKVDVARVKFKPRGRPIAFFLMPTEKQVDTKGSRLKIVHAGGSGIALTIWKSGPDGKRKIVGTTDWRGMHADGDRSWPASIFLGADIDPQSNKDVTYTLTMRSIAGTTTLTSGRLLAFELPVKAESEY